MTIEPTDQPQPATPPPPTGTVSHAPVPILIEPCAMVLDDNGNNTPATFHLLSCGHIVAIDEDDQRCGRNCQHIVTWTASQDSARDDDHQALCPVKGCTTGHAALQAIDNLYCETCNGIPIDRYKIMQLKEDQWYQPFTLRQSLAITRPVLQNIFEVPGDQIDDILCPPFFCLTARDHDKEQVCSHRLRCGHLVWSKVMRPCASNCMDNSGCRTAMWAPQGDAILCQECVARAELISHRYAKLGEVTMRNEFGDFPTTGTRLSAGLNHLLSGSRRSSM